MPNELPTLRLLSQAYAAGGLAMAHRLIEAGISDARASWGNVMEHLAFEDGLRQRDLADRAGITPQAIAQFVDELEALGYVERRSDPTDRRAKIVRLTTKGKRLNKLEWQAVRSLDERLMARLGARRLAALRDALTEVADVWGSPDP